MSLQQIGREFPRIVSWINGAHLRFSEDHSIHARVSRLSLEALDLSMENIVEERTQLDRNIELFDEHSRSVFHREVPGMEQDTRNPPTIGDELLLIFPPREKEVTEEVKYLLYTNDKVTAQFRVRKGSAGLEWKIKNREAILFKMPKNITLWELLQRYRRVKASRQ